MSIRVLRASKQISTRWVRAFSDDVGMQLSDLERAAGQGRTQPWHYTIPVDFKDTRTELNKAQHRGETPEYDKAKGALRKPGRMEGLLPDMAVVEEKLKTLIDEDGVFHPPHVKEMPSMTFKDCMVNYHFDYIGLKSPEFGEAEITEIESKTSLTRDNIHHVRYEWLHADVDMIDYQSMADDIIEMYKRGVSYRTINLYLDYASGSGSSYSDSITNRNWVRIDS